MSPARKDYSEPCALTSIVPSPKKEVVTLGGGCFWCLEAVYERVRGVVAVE